MNVSLKRKQRNKKLRKKKKKKLIVGCIRYHIIRVQVGISESMEDDIVNVIKTFKLSDASMVAPGPAQCYMLTLVIVKSLADITLKDSAWKEPFESCCKAIEQSSDMIDACVRVLKVASV